MDQCWIRPRYNGYLGFQEKAGELMEAHLRGGIEEDALLELEEEELELLGQVGIHPHPVERHEAREAHQNAADESERLATMQRHMDG